MSKYLLDTNICIHFMKGEYNLNSKIQQVGFGCCYIPEITIAELLYGVEKSAPERKAINLKRVQELRAAFSEQTVSISECLEEYARQKALLIRKGRRVEDLDIFIGASAIVKGMTLVTRNTKDFINMDGIQLENWIEN